MKVSDIMTRPPIAARPDVSIRSAARLLVEHRVSGAPVVNEANELVGIISEGDLIMRQAPNERRPWWHLFFVSEDQLAREFQKRAGTTIEEVMTRRVIAVSPDLDVATAAAPPVLSVVPGRSAQDSSDGRGASRGRVVRSAPAPASTRHSGSAEP